jgi:hypothetical protein
MTTKLTPAKLDEIEGLLARATPYPWRRRLRCADGDYSVESEAGASVMYFNRRGNAEDARNAELVVALKNAAPALLAAARERDELATKLAEVRAEMVRYTKSEGCSCCQDKEAHTDAASKLGALLGFKRYHDSSGVDWEWTLSPAPEVTP